MGTIIRFLIRLSGCFCKCEYCGLVENGKFHEKERDDKFLFDFSNLIIQVVSIGWGYITMASWQYGWLFLLGQSHNSSWCEVYF